MALHAEIISNPAASVPLVLLHGFGARAAVWRPVTARLPERVATIAYDMPGHAGSLGTEPGGAGRLAKAVLADLDQRSIPRFHLCGHSLGGATAALMALRNPARVASLTLLAPGGFGQEIDAEALADWRDAGDELSLRAALKPMCAEGFEFPVDALAVLAEGRSLDGARGALAAIYETMFMPGEPRSQGMLPVAELARLPMPVTLLWGTADRILPVRHAEGLPDNVRVERLDGAGHMLIEERLVDVARELMEAIRG